jgi:TIR domain/Protein of unknown function (DUF421)/WD domain, G-beta repeat
MLQFRFRVINRLVDGLPTLLVDNGAVLHDRLWKLWVDESAIMEAARELQGLERIDQVKYAVLERSGTITIVPSNPSLPGGDVPAAPSGGIFISYRRQDASHLAGRLYDRLADQFGEAQIFMDVDTIDLGLDFAEVIAGAVGTCQVLLALIGPRWIAAADKDGRPRLDNLDDFVRLEIQTALDRDVRVIPVLIDGAGMPGQHELPAPLARLSRRNALTMRHESFRRDADQLVAALERALALDPDPKAELTLRLGHEVNGLAVSADGLLLVTGSADGTARVWDLASGGERARFTHDDGVMAVAVSADGRLVAAGATDHTARVWELASGREHSRFDHDESLTAVALDADGALLATGSFDPTARVWDVVSGEQRTRANHDSMVASVALSPDGRLLATGSADHTARVWDAGSGRERTWVGHDAAVDAVALGPDGDLLATGGEDRTARVWEVASGEERTWVSHDGAVWAVALSPGGRLLATGSEDGTARVWEADSGDELARVTHAAGVAAVAFTPDGRRLATGSLDGTARIWTLRR